MNNDEYEITFNELRNILEQNFNWVALLALEEINMGKVLESKSNKKNRTDVEVREYSPKEKLEILIDCIEQTIVDTAFMERDIIKFFMEKTSSAESDSNIKFLNEIEENYFTITRDGQTNEVEQQAQILYKLLERLKETIDNDT